MASAEPSGPDFWSWWAVGLLMLALPMLASFAITVIGYLLGRTLTGPERPM